MEPRAGAQYRSLSLLVVWGDEPGGQEAIHLNNRRLFAAFGPEQYLVRMHLFAYVPLRKAR